MFLLGRGTGVALRRGAKRGSPAVPRPTLPRGALLRTVTCGLRQACQQWVLQARAAGETCATIEDLTTGRRVSVT